MDLLIIAVAIAIAGDCAGVAFEGEINNTATTNYYINFVEGEPLNIVDQYNNNTDNDDLCDESKCVSTGPSGYLFNYSFSCYTDGDRHPMMCADGYMPRIVENESADYLDGYYYYNGDTDKTLFVPVAMNTFQYFTCCPPNLSPDADVSRHCSNSTSINGCEDPINEETVFMSSMLFIILMVQ
jgi:hypothetical protein